MFLEVRVSKARETVEDNYLHCHMQGNEVGGQGGWAEGAI